MKMFVEPPAIYLHKAPVDFRKSINGLSAIVESEMLGSTITLTEQQWAWLLDGLDITLMKGHQPLHFSAIT